MVRWVSTSDADAVALTRSCDVIDLHLDTFIWPRILGYDPLVRHGAGVFGRRFYSHADLPRLEDGGVTGAMWSITTNPFQGPAARWQAFQRNLTRLRAMIAASNGRMIEARTRADYAAARAQGAHACLLAIQGLNALEGAPNGVDSLPDDGIVRATLVHLTNACYGATSSPFSRLRRDHGHTAAGRDAVAQLNARRVFVDLAHIHERAFWDAVAVHDKTQPLLVTHTGVSGVHPHWRNLNDLQLRAVADTGGVVGIIFSQEFLQRPHGPRDGRMIAEHVAHVVRVAGEDVAAIGSDLDGMIVPPPDVPAIDRMPVVTRHLLDVGLTPDQVRKVLGANFLRALQALRG